MAKVPEGCVDAQLDEIDDFNELKALEGCRCDATGCDAEFMGVGKEGNDVIAFFAGRMACRPDST